MDYEKKYKEALERAREWYNKTEPDSYTCIVESIFPELKDSEDERIRKELIQLISCMHDADHRKKDWIAWLEKQGEQKPVVPKFKVGDIVKDTEDGEIFTIRTVIKDKYIYTDDSFDWIKDQDIYELVEQKPTDNVEPKFKHGDRPNNEKKIAWSEEDKNNLTDTCVAIRKFYHRNNGAQELIDWLQSLKERMKGMNE